jgi:glycosyltransferase involved in cell wall biosynthesis
VKIALIADAYPPMRSSGAVQLRDLAREFARQGHEITVLVPASRQRPPWIVEASDGVTVIRLKSMQTRDTAYLQRTLGELTMPFMMRRNFKRSPLAERRFDGIVWYSPTIFLGPLIKALRRRHGCPTYLIIRDIFPEWAADMGLMRRGPAFRFFQAIADLQYSAADTIGVQTPGNLTFFDKVSSAGKRVEVLQNWLTPTAAGSCPIDLDATSLAGRKIFVYAGNMGVAQGMEKLFRLAENLERDESIGLVFVGRGSEVPRLRELAKQRRLTNVLFFDEVEPDELSGLYRQCSAGLLSLDPRHRTHNIPGKFISYMHAGLPVLASVNPGNDLEAMVRDERVGRISTDPSGGDLAPLARLMTSEDLADDDTRLRCKALAARLFSSEAAVRQIVSALLSRTKPSD